MVMTSMAGLSAVFENRLTQTVVMLKMLIVLVLWPSRFGVVSV